MGFENFATDNAQEEENLSEFEIGVRRMQALLETHGGDAYAATKTAIVWIDEAKKRYDERH